MKNGLRNGMQTLAADPGRLFLVDGTGAVVTASLLAGVVAPNEDWFGMPQRICYFLSALAVVYAAYSLSCYLWVRRNHRRWLSIIAAANVFYCLLTMALVICFSQRIRWPGFIYFLVELLVIAMLVRIERIAIANGTNKLRSP